MNRVNSAVILALGATIILAGGCRNQQSSGPPTRARSDSTSSSTHRPAWPRNTSDGSTTWTAMAHPTGDSRTSALGIELGTPREVRVNHPFDSTLVVTNLSNTATLTDVVVTEEMGAQFKMSKATPEGKAGQGGAVSWALGDLGPGQSRTITISGTTAQEAPISNCISATYNSSLCSMVTVVSPKLTVTKSGPAEVLRCEVIVYTYEVANAGTGTITAAKVSDALPAGLSMADGQQAAEFAVGDLAAGQKKTVTARVRAEKTGKYESKAAASALGDMSAESAVISTTVREPKLTITKKCPPKQLLGNTIDAEITVTNSGDGVSRDTVLEDGVPSGTQFVSASEGGRSSGSKVVWNLGDIEPKGTKTVTVALTTLAAGTVSNTATVRGRCAEQATASCQTEISGIPAILLEVIDIEDPSRVGSNNTYVITVTNQGTAAGTNIKLVCIVEANQTYISSQGPTAGTASNGTVTFAPLGVLAPKDKAVYRVTVKNAKVGDVRFKTTLTSDQLTRPVEETEATNVYE